MIDMLNRSTLQYFVPGNHEFDYGPLEFEVQLLARVKSKLVCCNVGAPATVKNASKFSLWPHEASPLVAFTGVVSKTVHESFDEKDWPFTDADDALEAFSTNTNTIPFHVVLSHATRDEDRAMRAALKYCPRTILLGGHDHHIDWIEHDRPPISLYKNRSNLQSVRILFLMAGGTTALNQLWSSYRELELKNGGVPPRYARASVDALLAPLHPCDARVFRPRIEENDAAWCEDDSRYTASDVDHEIPDDALEHRLHGIDSTPQLDVWSYKLTFDDFFPADSEAEEAVRLALKPITEPGEDKEVFNFSENTNQLDARDSHLRTVPTDFGLLVAECVRREGNADIAIVNSGAFRCDALLEPPKVTRRTLLDTFIFDKPKAGQDETIMTLTLKDDEIQTLLAHGLSCANKGAFPQVSDHRLSSKETERPWWRRCRRRHGDQRGAAEHVVAISSYLLINDNSTDGYVEAYAKWKGVSEDEARGNFRKARSEQQFQIIPAIEKHARGITYADITPVATQVQQSNPPTAATQFIDLARDLRTKFNRVFPYDPTNFFERMLALDALLELFARQAPVHADPAVADAREALSDFVYNLLMQLDCNRQAFWDAIKTDEANYADDTSYVAIFAAVVDGLGMIDRLRMIDRLGMIDRAGPN